EDVINAIEKIEKYTQGIKSLEEFIENDLVSDAVIRNLEIIGEASRKLPEEVYQKYSDIPWKNIIGLRNVIIHGYFIVDLEIIWKIIKDQIPQLKERLKAILEEI
ncbi:MAG: DUF86 domain-containing protein, partial [Caldimicrobium sp.]